MDALKEVVTHVLDQQGVLAKLKAELRANVFLALQDQGQKEKNTGFDQQFINPCRQKILETKEGQILFSLVREFLECAGMTYTLKVFEPEANLQRNESRKVLADYLCVPTNELQKGMPLLYTIISQMFSQNQENILDRSLGQKLHNFHDSSTSPIPSKRTTFDGQSGNQLTSLDEEDKKQGIQRKVSSGSTFSDSDLDLETESQLEMSQQLYFEDDHITSDEIQKEESMFFVGGENAQEGGGEEEEEEMNQNLFQVHRFNNFEDQHPGYGTVYSDKQLEEEIWKEANSLRQLNTWETDQQTSKNNESENEKNIDEITPLPKPPTKLGPLPSISGGGKLGSLPPLSLGGSRGKLEVSPQDLREELKQQGLISQQLDEDGDENDESGDNLSEDDEEDIEEDIELEDSTLSFGFETAEAVTPLGQLRTQEGNFFGSTGNNQENMELDGEEQQ